uniref:Radial spoke head 14 homolog n=1 Tax=Salarias fasciatus TaxID=181472 RepID=A0A672JFH7_SALFA
MFSFGYLATAASGQTPLNWTRTPLNLTRTHLSRVRGHLPLLADLQQPDSGTRLRVLASLLDLIHDPERLYQTVTEGNRTGTETLHTVNNLQKISSHLISWIVWFICFFRLKHCWPSPLQVLEVESLLPRRSGASSGLRERNAVCRPAGGAALLTLVPRLVLKLEEEEDEEEEEVLLLSVVGRCSRLDALPALGSNAVSLLRPRLTHRSSAVRREAAAAMMALSVPVDGKRQLCEQDVLRLIVPLLKDEDVRVQTNAAGVVMNTVILTEDQGDLGGRGRGRRKPLLLYSLQALSALAEAPAGRRLLLQQLPLLERRSQDAQEDPDVRQAAQTAIRVITWTP